MSTLLLNCSGHALSDATANELRSRFSQLETIPIDNIDFQQPVEPQLRRMLELVKAPLDGSIPVTLILPGHPMLAVLLCVYLHGILGHHPAVCLLQPDENGSYRPANIFYVDSQVIRAEARAFRQVLLRGTIIRQQGDG